MSFIEPSATNHYLVTASLVLTEPQKLAPIIKHSFNKVDFSELSDLDENIDISHLNPDSPEHLSFTEILYTVAPLRKFPM